MERIRKRVFLGVLASIAIVVLLLPTKLGPVIDRYNPFYQTKAYYTVVKGIGQHIGDGWYEYEFIGYDEDGREQKITKTIQKMLKQNEPLEIIAKGRYAERLVEIDKEDIPFNVRGKLLTIQ